MSLALPDVRVLVFDDERGSAADIAMRLNQFAGLEVTTLENPDLAIGELEARRFSARQSKPSPVIGHAKQFDDADVLVVDYDLTGTSSTTSIRGETGERVAYLARCYSQCGVIIALNQFSFLPVFDLTLVGHPGSFADLNISRIEIENPALWGEASDGYQPWHWPNMREEPLRYRERLNSIQGPDVGILGLLGLADTRVANTLTRKQLTWISPDREAHKATVADSISGGRLGLKPKDRPWGDRGIERVAAARLCKWLSRLVLPGQDVLVDEPHLAVRFPSLLTSAESVESLPFRIPHDPVLNESKLSGSAYRASLWTGRPVWYWPTLSDDAEIDEIGDPFAAVSDIGVFAEDVSRILPRGSVRPFTCDYEPFSRRYVSSFNEGDSRYEQTAGTKDVEYLPYISLVSA